MEMDKNTQQKLQELQLAEQNFQNFSLQKQGFQIELNETQSALEEAEKADGDMFKITGQIMIKVKKQDILKDMGEKQKILNLRISSIEKQEKILRNKLDSIKEELESKFNSKKK
tara:strand:+ start:1584 stop:1925 length:342 start_codon:yes stop_codon:yes gene_type:complete